MTERDEEIPEDLSVELAVAFLEKAGLVAMDARKNPPLLVMGGVSAETVFGMGAFKKPFNIVLGTDEAGAGIYIAQTARRGMLIGEERGTLAHVTRWLIANAHQGDPP